MAVNCCLQFTEVDHSSPPSGDPEAYSRLTAPTKDLFEQDREAATPSELTPPTIIEVPQWLARLEPKLAALDRDEPTTEMAERSE
jgi:hypothetical protein